MDIDVTILIQAGIVLVLMVTLNGMLFKPIMGVFDARHAKLGGARDDIDEMERLKASDLEAYQVRIRKANDEAHEAREGLRDEGRGRERELLSEVRAEIADALNGARQKVKTEEGNARQNLAAEVDDMGRSIASKILGREVGA
jgi:F-type H+-transporting ATPase subunit b